MSRLIVGPFNRVEGDLEVTLDIAEGRVRAAHVNSPMYRGFEQILQGKAPHDALVCVPRICGICSVSQTVAAVQALADMAGVAMPPNGRHVTNVILAIENLADHLTHFYLFFMPDFARAEYAGRPWHGDAVARFLPDRGEQVRKAIAARQRWFELMGTLAGKWPHTQSLEPGGSPRAIEPAERTRLLARVREFRGFLERELFGGTALEAFDALPDEAALWDWHVQQPGRGDFRLFLSAMLDPALAALGPGPGRYLSYGAYPQPGGGHAFAPGVGDAAGQQLHAGDTAAIREDATHAWLSDAGGPRPPSEGLTEPAADKPGAYTWNKAPRLAPQVTQTGAIARQPAAGHPLIRDAVARHGGTVFTRVLARVLELARVVPRMEQWLQQVTPNDASCVDTAVPDEGV